MRRKRPPEYRGLLFQFVEKFLDKLSGTQAMRKVIYCDIIISNYRFIVISHKRF